MNLVHRPADDRYNLVVVVAFGYIIERSVFYRLYAIGNISVSRQQYYFNIGSNSLDTFY
jgi:hypothetical protein